MILFFLAKLKNEKKKKENGNRKANENLSSTNYVGENVVICYCRELLILLIIPYY